MPSANKIAAVSDIWHDKYKSFNPRPLHTEIYSAHDRSNNPDMIPMYIIYLAGFDNVLIWFTILPIMLFTPFLLYILTKN